MSDNTTTNSGTGGDTIRTIERITSTQDPDTGAVTNTAVKTQAIELLTGASINGASPEPVSEANPLYVADTSVRRLLEDILDALERGNEILERLE